LRLPVKAVESTWARGTVNMVDPDGKVEKISRGTENPDKSRAAWA